MSISTTEIRQAFLNFFYNKGHHIIASSSLVPQNDPTLLFTNAGMNQFKDIFLGLENCNYSCATTAQRCVRAGGKHNDLENVGYTTRHHTFFEMLGNFSFGDYFKQEAIQYAWQLLTSENWFNLPKENLWVTVYENDHETYDIWEKKIDIPRNHIISIGDNKGAPYSSDNFWYMDDTGPCGPCTEIFYDHGEHMYGSLPGSTEDDGDRYVELWNIVFMQFNRHADGTMEPLPQPSVDTGMGLERIAAVLQHVNSNYDIDLFRALIEEVANVVGVTDLSNTSLRVIADHIRSCTFLIADGVMPSNENRGYVLRRIIRRAIRYGNMLGAKNAFFYKLVKPLISIMGSTSFNLKYQKEKIEQVLEIEEKQFTKTLERGLVLLDEELKKLTSDTLDGATAFRLYDTYGFPIHLTTDICREHNITVNQAEFENLLEKQRYRAREASFFKKHNMKIISVENTSNFKGYDHLELKSKVTALFCNGRSVNSINMDQDAIVFLDKTPFYAESGGQIGDQGEIKGSNFTFIVSDTQKYGQMIGHIGKLTFSSLKVGEEVQAQVNKARRARILLNHTATHLMHAALRRILGTHIIQKGSLITDKILRFDFSHFQAMQPSEILLIENLVNEQIRRNLLVETKIMSINEVKKRNIVALFSKKYNKYVRVLSIGDFSTEVCSGTHVSRTGDIGLFHIISELGIAAGVRRIEAMTGEFAITNIRQQSDLLCKIANTLKCSKNQDLSDKICNTLKHNHQMKKELKQLKERVAILESSNLSSKAIKIKGINLLVSALKCIEPKMLRIIIDNLKNQLGSTIIVLGTVTNNKVFFIAGVSKDLTDRIKAMELINMVAQQVNGKGNGRPELAQGGGTNISELPSALANIESWINKKLNYNDISAINTVI